jgi:hypothetical protein
MTDLAARRQQYEANTGLSGPGPNPPAASPADTNGLSRGEGAACSVQRTDEVPTPGSLADKRAAAEAADKARLLNSIPPGAIVRIDDEPKDAKQPIITPEKALAIANALTDLVARARADDDTAVKSPVTGKTNQPPAPDKPGSSPLNRQDDEEEKPRKAAEDDNDDKDKRDDNDAPSLKAVMDAIGALNKRLDSMEADGKDDDAGTEDIPTNRLAADEAKARNDSYRRRMSVERGDEAICDWRSEDQFAAFQARVDSVASLFGQSAGRPIHGETLGAFKRRSVRPWQSLSPTFRDVDLRVLQKADGIAFNAAINDILKYADAEGRRPTRVPLGVLIERSETKRGHIHTKFYGSPKSWMAPFMVPGKRVRRITERSDSGPGRVIYELQARA